VKITIFGATGGIGGHLVRQAIDVGHEVTAVVRDPTRFQLNHPELGVVTVPDLADTEMLRLALEGREAALSAVGPRGRKDGPVASGVTRGILRALTGSGIRRFVAVSAAPVAPAPHGDSFLNRRILLPCISAVLRDVYTDLADMEDAIRHSATDWTVIRPPKLVNKPLTGRYRTAVDGNVPRGYTIARSDVAHAMLTVLNDPTTHAHAIGVAK
jgi:uncharacterized protein YbjT (DUF2867 family)